MFATWATTGEGRGNISLFFFILIIVASSVFPNVECRASILFLEFGPEVKLLDGNWVTDVTEISVVTPHSTRPSWYGIPQKYKICDNSEFRGCDWIPWPYDGNIKYTLKGEPGPKQIFFKASDTWQGGHGQTASATVYLEISSKPNLNLTQSQQSSPFSATSPTAPSSSTPENTPTGTDYQKTLEAERKKTKALEEALAAKKKLDEERARQEAIISQLSTPTPQGPGVLPSSSPPAGASSSLTMERRIACLIGNASYKTISPLQNSVNDASDMSNTLKKVGFHCIVGLDANRTQMRMAVRSFCEEIKKGGVGLFFYAGHGVQIDGENYLIPVDADVQSKYEVEDQCLKVSYVLSAMEEANNKLNIVILDACRDNPFRGFRSAGRGLAVMNAPIGSILAYATGPGSVASDGKGRNGLYTSKLLKHLLTPRLSLLDFFINVRNDVLLDSSRKQIPWENHSLSSHFYFVP